MNHPLEPLKVSSLKEACVARLEELILSGELRIGERLPPEREFAASLGVSRPVLHEALVDLDAKGLVRIAPRHGVFVNDYRRSGSMAMLSSLLAYHDGKMDPAFTQSLIDMRLIVETETARLAAANRTEMQLAEFHGLLAEEEEAAGHDPQTLTSLDFSFHLSVAIASGNLVYPLIINSFNGVYTHLTGEFFRKYFGTPVVETVHRFHAGIVQAFEQKDAETAVQSMSAMLKHGEAYLKGERP
ncbi:MAG TPA: FadR/GntR family transcriptional regulator [Anaerolineales bacterium]|nr:FadR/GntR family transcriptional regulator [Anaerolineales bacterium]